MLSALASGTLVREAQQRQGSSGRPYATASMRVPCDGDEAVLVSIVAFSTTAIEALLGLKKGDTLAVTGRAKLTSWEKDGETHHGLSVVAEQVMTHYQLEKRRTRAQAEATDA